MNADQIKHMVDRFLMWPLPPDFTPDNGISYKRPNYAPNVPGPSGTNLLDATQADAMVRHMVEGLPAVNSHATLTAALAELAKLRAEAEWRLISEAPKTSDDFTSGAIEILAWCPDETARHGGDHRVVWWEPKMGRKGQGRWQCDADFEVHPTLWRPLPKRLPTPPKEKGQ
jgi:hypothetical protein